MTIPSGVKGGRVRTTRRGKIAKIAATYVYASSQGQHTHSARTKIYIKWTFWILQKLIGALELKHTNKCCYFKNHRNMVEGSANILSCTLLQLRPASTHFPVFSF